MCLSFLARFKQGNKVGPDPEPLRAFSPRLIQHAKTQPEREATLLKISVSTRTTQSLTNLIEEQKSHATSWLSYDVNLDGNIITDGLTRHCPTRLQRHKKPLTQEMLLKKQALAEVKRNIGIENKRKTAMRMSSQKDKNAEKLEHAAQSAVRQTQVSAENRREQNELVKKAANKTISTSHSRILEAQRFAKKLEMDQERKARIAVIEYNEETYIQNHRTISCISEKQSTDINIP